MGRSHVKKSQECFIYTNTLCGQNIKFQYAKAGGTYINHWGLKG
jgi:hypothetical protein